jgi:uncharacterized protein YbjT (DUF2867 family)
MILVTGATGTIGRHLITTLLTGADGTGTGGPATVRAVTRDPAAAGLPDGVETVPSVELGLTGADALFLHPRVAGDRPAEIVELARQRGVRKVVVLCAMNVDDPLEHQPSRLTGDRNKEIEQAAIAGGLRWTSLRASSFASNTTRAFGPQVRFGDVVRYPFRGFEESLVDERDLAEVAARALRGEDLDGRVLELTGPQSLTHGEQVAVLGAVLGRTLRFEEVPAGAAAAQMIARGMPEPFVTALMERYARHLDQPQHPPTDVVEKILGRPARTFAQWIAAHRAAF